MALTNHDQLETWVGTLTAVIGIGGGGWIAYAKQQRNDILEKIDNLKDIIADHSKADSEGFKTQWVRIDEIKEKFAKKEDLHDQWERTYDTLHKTAFKEDLDIVRKRLDEVQVNYVSRVEFKDDLRNTIALAITPLKISMDMMATQITTLAGQVAKLGAERHDR